MDIKRGVSALRLCARISCGGRVESLITLRPMGGRRWVIDTLGGEVRIELEDFSSHHALPGESERQLDALLWSALSARDPAARRVVEEVFDALRGGDALRERGSSARGPGFESALSQELRLGAYSGRLRIERVEHRSVALSGVAPRAAAIALGPDTTRDPAPALKTWIGLILVDQNGEPIPARPYRVIHANGTTFNGNLDAAGSATLTSIDPGMCDIWCPYVAPHPELVHPVGSTDHASGVAETYGFDDFNAVWTYPANADLQDQRPDAHVLAPDDSLTIPEIKATPTANRSTGARHRFTLQRTTLKVRVKVLDRVAKPMTGASLSLNGSPLTSDGTGLVEAPIAKTAPTVALQYADATFTLTVGAINPVDDTTEAGWRARLFNLGFLWDPAADDDANEMTIALEDFQAEYGLTLSGQLDDATKAQISQVYGS